MLQNLVIAIVLYHITSIHMLARVLNMNADIQGKLDIKLSTLKFDLKHEFDDSLKTFMDSC